MKRALCLAYLTVLIVAARLPAQIVVNEVIAPGSTPQGDYLRGVGVAAYGLGQYNLLTAEAESIEVDTTIRWNEYVWSVLKNQNRENAEDHARKVSRHQENYKKIRDRIRNSPMERDVMSGDALNDLMEQLVTPKNYESYYKSLSPPLPVDLVRRIPFKLDERGARISMYRLSSKGKDKWPIGLMDPGMTRERRAYERAFDHALDRQIDGVLIPADVKAVQQKVEELAKRLDQVIKPSDDPIYVDSYNRVRELRSIAHSLAIHKVEVIVGDLERYAGTTVNDLRKFMQSHNLRFATAETKEERSLYPELFTILTHQREVLGVSPGEAAPDGPAR